MFEFATMLEIFHSVPIYKSAEQEPTCGGFFSNEDPQGSVARMFGVRDEFEANA